MKTFTCILVFRNIDSDSTSKQRFWGRHNGARWQLVKVYIMCAELVFL